VRIVLGLCVLCASLSAAEAPELWYNAPAADWRHALPIGNGRLAAMVFGGVAEEHLQLNQESVFAGSRFDRVNPKAHASLGAIRKLLLADNVKAAEELASKDFLAVPRRQPPYETLGDLKISFGGKDDASDYRRSLDLWEGIAKVSFTIHGAHYTREAFVSYPDDLLVVHLTCDRPKSMSFQASLSRPADATVEGSGSDTLFLSGIAMPPDDQRHQYAEEPKTGAAFAGELKVITDGGMGVLDNHIEVERAGEATLLFSASTHLETGGDVKKAAAMSYSQLRSRHVADFESISKRVSLNLGANAAGLPTDELLAKTVASGDDRALTALYFAYGRYLLESSSRDRSLAANLQGKWNEQLDPAWGSKYTININTEMNYWPAESCNLADSVGGLLNLLRLMKQSGGRDAHEMYGTAGFVAHHNTDVWGDTEPIDGVPSGVWPMGAAWLTLGLWEHYDYSRDGEYLRASAYPLMRDAALYLADNLFPDGHGHLVSGPSLSPENRYLLPDGTKASLDVSPTMDVEITTELFRAVMRASEILDTDAAFRKRLAGLLPQLMPLQVGKYGQLQEWRKDYPESELGHRHLSHLFGVYPGSSITPETPKFYKAARVSLDRRLANGGGGTGWSRAWVTALWATFHEGDKAGESLRVLYGKSTWPNLFDTHPPDIFQIDGNLGATAAIAQMLAQSRDVGLSVVQLELLPALPANWANGSVTGLRVRGGVMIDLVWKDHALQMVTLRAGPAIHLTIKVPGQGHAIGVELKKAGVQRLMF
jgi:alpha-L-fucosidase 2